ncbi:MAG: glycosyltransferase family 9 protein [Pseudomonadota bacterium]
MKPPKHERILVIQLRQLGDILLTTPILREIKKAKPEAEVTFLSHAMGRLVVDGNPYLDRHLTYSDTMSWREELSLIQKIRSFKFDYVLDFMFNPKSCFYVSLSGAKKKVSFESSRSVFFDMVVPRGGGAYIVDEKFRILRAIGISPSSISLDLPWDEHHIAPIQHLLKAGSFAHSKLRVVISPTHRRAHRRWPLKSFSELAMRLIQNWGAEIIWLWGPGEEALCDEAIAMTQLPTLKAPKTSFKELAALISNCDLFIGNSNGPSHIAVAADIVSLQFHGPTLASSWCPMTSKHHAIQSHDGTIQGLTTEEVWSELERMKDFIFHESEARKKSGLKTHWKI